MCHLPVRFNNKNVKKYSFFVIQRESWENTTSKTLNGKFERFLVFGGFWKTTKTVKSAPVPKKEASQTPGLKIHSAPVWLFYKLWNVRLFSGNERTKFITGHTLRTSQHTTSVRYLKAQTWASGILTCGGLKQSRRSTIRLSKTEAVNFTDQKGHDFSATRNFLRAELSAHKDTTQLGSHCE